MDGGEYGGSDSFGDSSGFTGSEGASLGGDFSGTSFGEGFGDGSLGGLGGFGLDAIFSNPSLAGLGFDDSFSLDDSNPFAGIDYGMPDSLEGALSNFGKASETDLISNLLQGKYGKGLTALLGLVNPMAGKAAQLGTIATSPNPGKGMANMGINMGLSALGPAGMALGMLGNATGAFSGLTGQFGNTVGLQGGSPADNGPGGSGLDLGKLAEGLGGIYSGYKSMQGSGDMLSGLQGLYSQNSPYAQQLAKQLQRQDAASGRRSQYGGRAVELQARLAQMASNQIPAMSQLRQQQDIARAAMLKNGIGAFQGMGGLRGLQDLFGLGGAGGMFENAAQSVLNGPNLFELGNIAQGFNPADYLDIPDVSPWGGP